MNEVSEMLKAVPNVAWLILAMVLFLTGLLAGGSAVLWSRKSGETLTPLPVVLSAACVLGGAVGIFVAFARLGASV